MFSSATLMSTRRSLVFSFLDRYAGLGISVVSSMIIARLLSPAEIGVFSIVMVLLTFASTVRDMGAGQYLVQERELTTDRIRAVWAVQLGLGLSLACVVVIGSYPVSLFYGEPRMFPIMLLVALNYVVNPFGSLTYAWLTREMRFERIALMRFVSALTGAVVSIVCAYKGLGPISLAFGSLAGTSGNAFLALFLRPASFPWMPGFKEVRRVVAFGSRLTASSIMTVASNNAPELILGKLQGMAAAGLYSRASGLIQMFQRMFVDAVATVCLPWFASESRERGNAIAPFLKATAYMSALGWSFSIGVACLAYPLIRLLYGNQWDAAVDLARLLAGVTACAVPMALCQTALLSSGAVSIIARTNFVCTAQSIAFVGLGSVYGLEALGVAMIVASFFTTCLWLRAVCLHLKISLGQVLQATHGSAWVALCAGVGPVCVLWSYGTRPQEVVAPLAVGFIAAVIGFLGGLFLVRHPLREEVLFVMSKLRLGRGV